VIETSVRPAGVHSPVELSGVSTPNIGGRRERRRIPGRSGSDGRRRWRPRAPENRATPDSRSTRQRCRGAGTPERDDPLGRFRSENNLSPLRKPSACRRDATLAAATSPRIAAAPESVVVDQEPPRACERSAKKSMSVSRGTGEL
jgi:hypothetical protein